MQPFQVYDGPVPPPALLPFDDGDARQMQEAVAAWEASLPAEDQAVLAALKADDARGDFDPSDHERQAWRQQMWDRLPRRATD
ncbi:hypothetical protein [Actinoplanes sp. NPDC026670]|uniref:hypothetical protein n=1 Tax=Actinoplanes sp. NPDC026670 TaxID=3154700 RepID=UPI0033EA9605